VCHAPAKKSSSAGESHPHALTEPDMRLAPHFAAYLWTFQWKRRIFFAMSKEQNTEAQKSEVLQGTLDLMAPKVLDALPAAAWVWDRPPD
jgi:hypothetical protein